MLHAAHRGGRHFGVDSRGNKGHLRHTRRLARVVLWVTGAAAALVVTAYGAEAVACSCAVRSPEEQLVQADLVFTGTVARAASSVSESSPATLGALVGWRYELSVDRYFKGELGQTVSITMDSLCEQEYEAGQPYLVFATLAADGTLTDSLCSGTRPLRAGNSGVPEFLGVGTAPDPAVTRVLIDAQASGEPTEQQDLALNAAPSDAASTGCALAGPIPPQGARPLASVIAVVLGGLQLRRARARTAR
jgi:hypothetical protein